jgi:hypothetical protein
LVAIGGDAEDVGPVVEGVLDVGFGSEEFVDQSRSFVGVFRREEGFGFAGGGDATDEVEVDAADEGVVVSGGVALEFVFFPVGTQDGVDGGGFSRDIRWGSDEAELGQETEESGKEKDRAHGSTNDGPYGRFTSVTPIIKEFAISKSGEADFAEAETGDDQAAENVKE